MPMQTPSEASGPSAPPLSIVVVGGSGDLARQKIFPALFALHSQGFLPENTHFFGLARTEFTDDAFREHLGAHLTCRHVPEADCARRMRDFLSRCHYQRGAYDDAGSFLDLYQAMRAQEGERQGNRIYYMAIPPFLFLDVARAIGDAGLVDCGGRQGGWSRVVIEKPFGRDRLSSDALVGQMALVFNEYQTYRIDHYLGKEMIQNLMALRFANQVFEPVWNRRHVDHVLISFKEDFGVGSRAGYFDRYGIVRDVMQNHLLQILALVAMERPTKYQARPIREEKVRVLGCIPPIGMEDLAAGQYAASDFGGKARPGYREEADMPPDTRTPTYAAAALSIRNERWEGVPFFLQAGKGLNERCAEVRVRFRPAPDNLLPLPEGANPRNELVIRVQPREAVTLRIWTKVPGRGMVLAARDLDLQYASAFPQVLPEAYESLLLLVVQGDKSLFIGSEELEKAWDIFTPVLHRMEAEGATPESYPFGSPCTPGAAALAERHGVLLPG